MGRDVRREVRIHGSAPSPIFGAHANVPSGLRIARFARARLQRSASGEGALRPQRATPRGARGARPSDLPILSEGFVPVPRARVWS